MDIFVCTDDARVKAMFGKLAKAKANPLRFAAAEDAAAAVAQAAGPALFYLDSGSLAKKKLTSLRQAIAADARLRFAIIDPDGEVDDPAALLQAGALDYIGPKLCRTGITAARINQSLAASKAVVPAAGKKTPQGKAAIAGPIPARDWSSVKTGGEYRFRMLYIELDGHKDSGLRSSESMLGRLIAYFQKAVERALAAEGGRLWIWTDFSGIVLFPIAASPDAVTAAVMRLMLSRRLVSMDQDIQKLLFSYRLVLIDGATVYRERGRTDTIISDAVNSLSHIGAKYSKPGNFYMAADIHAGLSPALKKCFIPAGAFEGIALVKMKLPGRY
jgi:hypothetical protein